MLRKIASVCLLAFFVLHGAPNKKSPVASQELQTHLGTAAAINFAIKQHRGERALSTYCALSPKDQQQVARSINVKVLDRQCAGKTPGFMTVLVALATCWNLPLFCVVVPATATLETRCECLCSSSDRASLRTLREKIREVVRE